MCRECHIINLAARGRRISDVIIRRHCPEAEIVSIKIEAMCRVNNMAAHDNYMPTRGFGDAL